jgi:hypothetical protein
MTTPPTTSAVSTPLPSPQPAITPIAATVAPPRKSVAAPASRQQRAAAVASVAHSAAPPAPTGAVPAAVPISGPVVGPPKQLRVGVAQVVCWQVVLGGLAWSVGWGWWVTVVAALAGLAVLGGTATWWRELWTYQWLGLGVGYLVRGPRFRAIDGFGGHLEIGDEVAGCIVRSDGVTVLLETDVPPEVQPSDLVEEQTGVRVKLVRRPGRAWMAVTAPRTAGRHQDAELELILANAVRRLVKRLRRRQLTAVPLTRGELADALAVLTPKQATEEWDGLQLGTGRYRMYAVPPQLALRQPGALTVTTSSDLDHALVMAPADAPPGNGVVLQTGRQRAAFTASLP